MNLSIEDRLKLISRAWGKQTGYVFFPWIPGDAVNKAQRIRGYNEGPAFVWPRDRAKIVQHLKAHTDDDIYFCPSIFEKPVRRMEQAGDEHALWADLDTVDPRTIDEQYRPTIAWESSPGRYQALWLITGGDIQGASWPGNENQKLTYYLGADPSGWDTTQLLRIPGWENHKPEYRDANDGKPVPGRLLWHNGRRYLADEFDDLPAIGTHGVTDLEVDALEDAINAVNRHDVWGAVRLKVSKAVRDYLAARETGGKDRSETLWQIERDLADVGCTVPQIVAIVRDSIWNKFAGRNDELRRLVTEATKAVSERSEATEKTLEVERQDKPTVGNLFDLVKNAPPPVWLVKDIMTEGSCGFFAGEPKSFKSWTSLDFIVSVASGAPFLGAFEVLNPGPVLYIQEEDPLPTIKDRLGKLMPTKTQDRVILDDSGGLVWEPSEMNGTTPPINAIVREQFVISDTSWQSWLDEVLADGYGGTPERRAQPANDDGIEEAEPEVIQERVVGEPYRLIVLDPLMMMAGEVEENRSHEMTTKIYKPLKVLAEKHHVAILVIHHMGKMSGDAQNRRGGQRMLGSVANHAWSENSLYFTHGPTGTMIVESESKFAPSRRFKISGLRRKNPQGKLGWFPEVEFMGEEDEGTVRKRGASRTSTRTRTRSASTTRAVRIGQGTRKRLARELGLPEDSSQTEVRAAWEAAGKVWGEWGDAVHPYGPRDTAGDEPRRGRGRPPVRDPNALKALRKLTERKPRAYTTNEVRDELAAIEKVPPTQTLYLKAYQQLKKLMEQDRITRVGKDWLLSDTVTEEHLKDHEVEELI